jgi:hypothetical protein
VSASRISIAALLQQSAVSSGVAFFLPLTHAVIGQVVEAANGFFVADAKEAARCVKKMLKCSGCGALCSDTAEFQVRTSI